MGRQGKTGATGPRGPQGVRGATGVIGRRGKIGKPGHQGLKGFRGPLHADNMLDMIVTHFDDVYQQLNVQLKWIAKMQQEVDVMTATIGKAR